MTIKSLHRFSAMAFAIVLSAALLSCSKTSSGLEDNATEKTSASDGLSLAFNITKDITPATKTMSAIAQADNQQSSFRGIEMLRIFPFHVATQVSAGDTRSSELELPYNTIKEGAGVASHDADSLALVLNNKAHLYRSVYIPKGVSSMLVYGRAKDNTTGVTSGTPEYKHRNGSLTMNVADDLIANDITFSPEPIVSASDLPDLYASAEQMAAFLNGLYTTAFVVNFYSRRNNTYTGRTTSVLWPDVTGASTNLTNLRDGLKNIPAGKTDGDPFSASGTAILNILNQLKEGLSATDNYNTGNYPNINGYTPYSNNSGTRLTYNEFYNRYRASIVTYINNCIDTINANSTLSGFPASYGLPDGSVALYWNSTTSAFEVVETSSVNIALAPVEKYCYPPSLWYFVNSTIKTSADDQNTIKTNYVSTNSNWSDILSAYTLGRTVTSSSKAVAVEYPLQYGTALLEAKLDKTTSTTLDDAEGTDITVGTTNFPVTGIIIGGQHRQNFSFAPFADADEYFSYDNNVLSNGTSGTSVYLSSSAESGNIYSLVLQTVTEEDVKVVLEFQNNCGSAFVGASGNIPTGSHFYLIGEIKKSTATDPTLTSSVFQQDYKTTVTFKVNTLANAYSCIPNLQDPQLEIGVQVQVDWILADPKNVPLY